LGSERSRAAARQMLLQKRAEEGQKQFTLINDLYWGEPHIGPWVEAEDGELVRICNIPEGMSLEEAERIIAERCTACGPELRTVPNALAKD